MNSFRNYHPHARPLNGSQFRDYEKLILQRLLYKMGVADCGLKRGPEDLDLIVLVTENDSYIFSSEQRNLKTRSHMVLHLKFNSRDNKENLINFMWKSL